MQNKKLKVGVIGAGFIGKSHLKAYKDTPEAELIALADIESKT